MGCVRVATFGDGSQSKQSMRTHGRTPCTRTPKDRTSFPRTLLGFSFFSSAPVHSINYSTWPPANRLFLVIYWHYMSGTATDGTGRGSSDVADDEGQDRTNDDRRVIVLQAACSVAQRLTSDVARRRFLFGCNNKPRFPRSPVKHVSFRCGGVWGIAGGWILRVPRLVFRTCRFVAPDIARALGMQVVHIVLHM